LNPESKHVLIDAWGVPFSLLDNQFFIEKALLEIAKATGSTVVGKVSHKFKPQGVSAVVLVAESHCAIHTYPEENYFSADIFTCGNTDPEKAIPLIEKLFKPSIMRTRIIVRGRKSKRR